eukprot:TRINITY_DN9282_c0_g1_i1.p1 TRINITY_DN9282_c0_g1~~TRINITY_DN9282_c0_g1_i1.p1  ORF type:complete len:151 (-),score=39.46 TRINITY_DN9282_c0_g1_i1:295-747(-)
MEGTSGAFAQLFKAAPHETASSEKAEDCKDADGSQDTRAGDAGQQRYSQVKFIENLSEFERQVRLRKEEEEANGKEDPYALPRRANTIICGLTVGEEEDHDSDDEEAFEPPQRDDAFAPHSADYADIMEAVRAAFAAHENIARGDDELVG